jgi:hypothetical protein
MSGAKWFYPAQKKITAYLDNIFVAEGWRCDVQDICPQMVYEVYTGRIDGQLETVVFMIYKPTRINHPALIRVFWEKTEDTMQYLKD